MRSMTVKEMQEAVARLRKSAAKPEPCPKCGVMCYVAKAAPHAVADLEAIGYDGSCCFFDGIES